MKKLVFLFAFVSLFMLGVHSTVAQVNYSFLITWSDANCDCGTIIEKELKWEVWDINATPNTLIGSGTVDITYYVNDYHTVNDNGNVIYDCRGCYQMKVWIRYKESGGWCCSGNNTKTTDGDKLVNGSANIGVSMN